MLASGLARTIYRIGQNRIYTVLKIFGKYICSVHRIYTVLANPNNIHAPCMTVYLVVSLQKKRVYTAYMVLANPTCSVWHGLQMAAGVMF